MSSLISLMVALLSCVRAGIIRHYNPVALLIIFVVVVLMYVTTLMLMESSNAFSKTCVEDCSFTRA